MANIKISALPGSQNITGNWQGNVIIGTYGGTGVNNGTSLLTYAANVTFAGAFASTLTFTAPTSITFPTSGTLVNTGVTTLSSLASIGTITTGVWQATPVALAYGGTNANLTASNGGIFYSTATAGAILAGTATARQMLQSGATAAPAWSTATWPATTTINQILYSSAANTVTGLATANNAVLVTDSGGVPSLSTTLPAGIVIPSPSFGSLATFTGGEIHNVTQVTTATYTALTTDYILACNRSGAIAITLIASPATGRTYRIKDISGAAATNNITITPAAGLIDGASSLVINTNYYSVDLVYTGSAWSIL